MKLFLHTLMVSIFLTLFQSLELRAQCAANMGFENGNFGSWTTSTDSLYTTPGTRVYSKPGKNQAVVTYGSADAYLGVINAPNASCGNKLIKVGNRTPKTAADTVYRTYIIDSLSDKLTIYSKGAAEIIHNYWGLATIESSGFGYEVYINGKKIDCLKGSFFCGNADTPYVWNVGTFKDTASVRKSVGWASEVLNFACFVGDTVEIRLFTRDCTLSGHWAYAFFDIVCSDTTKPAITKIMVNDIIAGDRLDLYCTDSAKLKLNPNTAVCPIFRGNVNWSPTAFVYGASNTDSVRLRNLDSGWIYATATFSNFCSTINVRDSIYVKVNQQDPHNFLPKLPRNFCDCRMDTLDFGTSLVTTVKDQAGNTMTLTNGVLIISPCDKFYEECYWKSPSAKIQTTGSKIGTLGWVSGSEGAIGVDSILATGTVRYIINVTAAKKFYAGISTTNINNSNDMSHSIYVNGGAIGVYYNGALKASIGSFSGTITVDFKTLANNKVEIWINGVKVYSYSNAQKAVFPVFPDFSANSNDTNLIFKTYVYGPTKNMKDFTRLLLTAPYKYFISYTDRCGVPTKDTMQIIPGFSSSISPSNTVICGLDEITILTKASGSSIIDDIVVSSDGDGDTRTTAPNAYYAPAITDYANNPIAVYITTQSGRCIDTDTAFLTFNEVPVADAGADISSPPATYAIGGSPSGLCGTCSSMKYAWTPKVALNDSTMANPTVTTSLVNNNFFALKVRNPVTGCFSMDTAFILAPLPINEVSISSNCLLNNKIEFTWTLAPSIEAYSFGIEYSIDNGSNWISLGKIVTDLNIVNNELKEYKLLTDKIADQEVLYRWYTFNLAGDKKSIKPIYDVDCKTKTSYRIYPNPFSKELNLDIHTNYPSRSNLFVIIYNAYGQKVYEKNIETDVNQNYNQFLFNGTESLTNGIYFMNIISNDKVLYKTKITKLN